MNRCDVVAAGGGHAGGAPGEAGADSVFSAVYIGAPATLPLRAGTGPSAMNLERDLAARRKRLRFRCWHRGSREADLLLGPFADMHVHGFDVARLDRLERLLACDDPDIWDWAVRGAAPPAGLDTDVLALLRARIPAPPEERR